MTQAAVSRLLGIDQSGWNRWEKGNRTPDPWSMIEVCARFRVTMDFIYRGWTEGLPPRLAVRLAKRYPDLVTLPPNDTEADMDTERA